MKIPVLNQILLGLYVLTSLQSCSPKKNSLEENIQPDWLFQSKFVEIDGKKVHFVENGQGTESPVLLIHGNPTSVYIWRNIITQIKNRRVVAVDLLGMGKSTKRIAGHSLYFENLKMLQTFIKKLDLKKPFLVGHDWGGALAYSLIGQYLPSSGIALIEPVIPRKSSEFPLIARILRGTSFLEWYMTSRNYFVETMLPDMTLRDLSRQEMTAYRAPFTNKDDIKITYDWYDILPVDGQPLSIFKQLTQTLQYTSRNPIPKLIIYATPGVLVKKERIQAWQENMINAQFVNLGDGKHFLQEDHPHSIAKELSSFFSLSKTSEQNPRSSSWTKGDAWKRPNFWLHLQLDKPTCPLKASSSTDNYSKLNRVGRSLRSIIH